MYPYELFLGLTLYDILFFVGVLMALVVYRIYSGKRNVPAKVYNFYLLITIIAISVGYLSAILFQSVYNFIETGVFELRGMTFLGGLIGGVVTFLACYHFLANENDRKYFPMMLNIAPACITIAHFFGRLGCFTAGCCHGHLTHSHWGVDFKIISDGQLVGTFRAIPTQLYEAGFLLVAFIVVSYLFFKNYRISMPVYTIGYGVFRFIIEFWRGDERLELIPGLSPSQALSLGLIAIGIILLIPVFQKKAPLRAEYNIG